MRNILLTSTILSLTATAALAQSPIGPGHSAADPAGDTWAISSNGSVQKNGAWVDGGGGTSLLAIQGDTVFGQDARTKQWFTLSGGQYWMPSAAPTAGMSPVAAPASAGPTPPTAGISMPMAAAAGLCSGASSAGSFGILPLTASGVGQIFDPNQKPYHIHGINVMEGDFTGSVSTAPSLFSGMNFVRLPIYNLDDDPAIYASAVQILTSAGIVVEIEDHYNGTQSNAGGGQGSVFTGALLAQEQAFYARFAAYYKGNPYVWWGTNNEPPNAGAALSAWQLQTYQTIRAGGNSAPIMLEMNGWADPGSFGSGYDPSAYAQMSNVIWDMHFYGWLTNMSTDQGVNNAFIAAAVKQAQKITSAGGVTMPVIIGEYGNSTTGLTIDPNGTQAVEAVQQASVSGVIAGTAAWAYAQGNPGDGLLSGGGLSGYGQQVASYIQQAAAKFSVGSSGGSASCQVTASSPALPTQASAQIALTIPQPPDPLQNQGSAAAPTTPIPAVQPPQVEPLVTQSQSAMAQTETDSAAAMTQIQAAVNQSSANIAALQALIQAGQGLPSGSGQ